MHDVPEKSAEAAADVLYHSKKLLKASRDARSSVWEQETTLLAIESLETKLTKARKQHVSALATSKKRCHDFEEAYRESLASKEKSMKISDELAREKEQICTIRMDRVRLAVSAMQLDESFHETECASFEKVTSLVIREIPRDNHHNQAYYVFSLCLPVLQAKIVAFLRETGGTAFDEFIETAVRINGLSANGIAVETHVLHRQGAGGCKEHRLATNTARYPCLTRTQLQRVRELHRRNIEEANERMPPDSHISPDPDPLSGETQVTNAPASHDSDDEYAPALDCDGSQQQEPQQAQSLGYSHAAHDDDTRQGARFEFAAVATQGDTYEMPSYMHYIVPEAKVTVYPQSTKHILHVAHNTEFGRTAKPGVNNVLHEMDSHYIDTVHCRIQQLDSGWVLRCFGYYGIQTQRVTGETKELLQYSEHDLQDGDIITFDNVEHGSSQFVYTFRQ